MREIKFRGKRIDNGEWVYGCLERYSEAESIIVVDMLEQDVHWVLSDTVGQFTGLRDKNGVEIYEGDVVRALCSPAMATKGKEKYHKCEVYYSDDFSEFRFPIIDIPNTPLGRMATSYLKRGHKGDAFEVIGNIHERMVQDADKR